MPPGDEAVHPKEDRAWSPSNTSRSIASSIPRRLSSLAAQIERSMRDVRVACADWAKMRAATRQVSAELSSLSAHFDAGDLSEALALLAWMEDRHFTFLGYREYRLQGRKGQEALRPVEATGLGILRRGHRQPTSSNRSLASDIRRQSRSRDIVLVTKANLVSTVHRSGHLDYVGIKHFDAKGRLIGEKRFLGLWTSVGLQQQSAGDSRAAPQGGAGGGALRAGARQP